MVKTFENIDLGEDFRNTSIEPHSAGQPHCGTASLRDHVIRRFAKFYNGISQGKNNKMKLISNISTYSDHRRKGTIGENVECISRLWNCSYDYLWENTDSTVDIETSDRVRAIKELTACKDNGDHLPIFDSSELSDLIGGIACYLILLNCDIKFAYFFKDKWIRTLVTVYCSYMMHVYYNLLAYSLFVFVPFPYCTTSTK